MKRTYQPKKKKRAKLHGFRNKKKNNSPTINKRRNKGRWLLTVNSSIKKRYA